MFQEEGGQNLIGNLQMEAAGFAYDFADEMGSSFDCQTQHGRLIEGRLIEAARDGNLSAFNQLVEIHQDSLYRWVLSLVKDGDLAEDLTQTTFITAYEKLCSFHGGSFRGWLFKISRNRWFDELRRQKRRPLISLDAARDDEEASGDGFTLLSVLSSDAPLPEEVVVQSERSEMISRVLEALSEGFRQVLQLVDMELMDYLEVSEVLQMPLGTVKSRLARARLKFRELAAQNGLLP